MRSLGLVDHGKVIFSDISQPLLDRCRSIAERQGTLDRTAFIRASADDLSPVEDESVDAVTTRSVLIYVDRKDDAFSEFHRVLRSGGRLSIFEPINRYFETRDRRLLGVRCLSRSRSGREDERLRRLGCGWVLRRAIR